MNFYCCCHALKINKIQFFKHFLNKRKVLEIPLKIALATQYQ